MKLYLFNYDAYLKTEKNCNKFGTELKQRGISLLSIEYYNDFMILDFENGAVPEHIIKYCENYWEADPEMTIELPDVDYRGIAFSLFEIIDDIDTASDIAKGDDKLYRRLVGHRVKDVINFVECDGINVKFKGE